MTKEEFNIWLKNNNGKCSVKDLEDLGFKYHPHSPYGYWTDDENQFALIFEDSVVELYQPPKTEDIIKQIEFYAASTAHFENEITYEDIKAGKKWYDKFYERKGRKYSRAR